MKSKSIIMDNNQLFKALTNSQSTMKAELLGEISKLRKDTEKGFKEVHTKMDKGFKSVNDRIDALGKQLNTLDEDAPTGDEFRSLVQRVEKIEQTFIVA